VADASDWSIAAAGLPDRVRSTEPGAGEQLFVERGPAGRAAWAYFLRKTRWGRPN